MRDDVLTSSADDPSRESILEALSNVHKDTIIEDCLVQHDQ